LSVALFLYDIEPEHFLLFLATFQLGRVRSDCS